jgi:hypothetical protein
LLIEVEKLRSDDEEGWLKATTCPFQNKFEIFWWPGLYLLATLASLDHME